MTEPTDITISYHGENQSPTLIEAEIREKPGCAYCGSGHVVKNGSRKDGTQRYLCRDCKKSFILSSNSLTSRTRKRLSVWNEYLQCMLDKMTLSESAEKCGISLATAFAWRHKILDTLKTIADQDDPDRTIEIDLTPFDDSYKGNHTKSTDFAMPRPARKRGNPATPGDEDSGDMDADDSVTEKEGKNSDGKRLIAYQNDLKHLVAKCHGVSTRHLDNYITWNDLIRCTPRKRKALMEKLFGEGFTDDPEQD